MAVPSLKSLQDAQYKPFRGVRKIDPFKPLKRPPIDLGKRRAKTALLAQIVPDLVTSMRTYHMRMATEGVRHYQAKGEVFQTGDPVVQLVDGSPSKPIRNVKLGGNITFAQNAGKQAVIEAAQNAFLMLVDEGQTFRRSGKYLSSLTMAVDGKVVQPSELDKAGDFEQITIYPLVPYSGKAERIHMPFYNVWRSLLAFGWMNRAAIKLVISENPAHQPVAGGKHTGIAMPLLVFQELGTMTSRPPNRSDFY